MLVHSTGFIYPLSHDSGLFFFHFALFYSLFSPARTLQSLSLPLCLRFHLCFLAPSVPLACSLIFPGSKPLKPIYGKVADGPGKASHWEHDRHPLSSPILSKRCCWKHAANACSVKKSTPSIIFTFLRKPVALFLYSHTPFLRLVIFHCHWNVTFTLWDWIKFGWSRQNSPTVY